MNNEHKTQKKKKNEKKKNKRYIVHRDQYHAHKYKKKLIYINEKKQGC